MAKSIYITHASLDGYIEDQTGAFDWSNPDQVFDFITELLRSNPISSTNVICFSTR